MWASQGNERGNAVKVTWASVARATDGQVVDSKLTVVYGCVANGSYFSVHHKFSIFKIKYVKKGENAFYVSLRTILPYVSHSKPQT